MHSTVNRIDTTTKFDPQDERIFCPNVNKEGVTGHGLLKKYYIPHLGLNICEYCEIEEDGERRNLSYYQSRKLSKHLISELQNWHEEILKFQNMNNDVNVKSLVNSLKENNLHLDASESSLNKCKDEVNSLKALLENKLLAYFSFLEEIFKIKDLIDECKFDAKGKLNLIGIGIDSTREAKYIWMSLLFSNMKRQHLNPDSFGLTEEVQKCIANFIELYVTVNYDCTGFVKNLCYNLLPEIARLENKQITIDCEGLINKLPTNGGVDVGIVDQLKARIVELEKQKESETVNLTVVINNINEENNRNRLRITELEKIIGQERKERDLYMAEVNAVNEKLKGDLREVKISHENLFLGNKELEALILAERKRAENYQESLDSLQAKYNELLNIRDNITFELHSEKQRLINLGALEKEIERLRKALTDKDLQNAEFNKKYYEMLSEYDYLKQSNESLKTQLEGHFTNYNLLTGINHGLAKRQTVMGEGNISSTSMKNLPIVEVQTNTSSKEFLINKSINESMELVSAGAPKKDAELNRSLFDSQIFINNDAQIPRATITSNAVFIPTNLSTPQKETNVSIPISRQSTYAPVYETEKYPKNIDFIMINPRNLLLTYSSLHRISDWINSQNTFYNIFQVNLLYKASFENFSAEKFKANCLGINETVIIALTNAGKVIGGYTPLTWQSGRNVEEIDSNKKTFLFSLAEGKMFPLKNDAIAITNKDNFGPIFGRNELVIVDDCNANEIEASNEFGSSFETNGISAEQFFGGSKFFIKEYEVYQIYPATF